MIDGKAAGAFGTFAVFSLGSTKYITGGSGGVLLTDSDALAARVSDLLEFDRAELRGDWSDQAPAALPGKLADLNAAVALVQLERMHEFADRRRAIAAQYEAGLNEMSQVTLMPSNAGNSYYRYIVKTAFCAAPLATRLRERGVDARSGVNPWLDALRFAGRPCEPGAFPAADRWRQHLLSLPIYPGLREDEASRIVREFRELARDA
jgi:perosamine synthetase